MKVLYVEDQPVNVVLMEALFALRPQFSLLVAFTGAEGLAAAHRDPPDLLLLDLNLPDCHGTDLLERMREHPALRHTPAAAVTADRDTDLSQTTFMETWGKPMVLADVLDRLDHLHAAHLQHATPFPSWISGGPSSAVVHPTNS